MGPKLGWLTLEYDKPGARAYVWSDQRCRHHGGLRTFVRGKMVRPAHGSVGDMRRRASDRWAGLVGSRSADLILRRTAVDCDARHENYLGSVGMLAARGELVSV